VLEVRPGLILPDSVLEWRAGRAGGPGGQHVNTTSTQVELRLQIDACDMLSPRVRRNLVQLGGSRVSNDGVLRIVCGSSRSQLANRDECEQRLRELILEALKPPPPPRRPTKPSRAAKRRRVDDKKKRGALKASRKVTE
jgi:ribosome-associated protein